MNEKIKVGSIVTGIVTGIQPYGAFLKLDGQMQGLIHISEITKGYVKDIRDYLSVGEKVHALVLDVDEEKGKVSLSLKAIEEMKKEQEHKKNLEKKRSELEHMVSPRNKGFNTLKEKLDEWIEQSKNMQLIEK